MVPKKGNFTFAFVIKTTMNQSETNSHAVCALLNDLLANYQVYYQRLRHCHWNIRGDQFFTLHVKFEEMYNDAQLKIDEIAERILTLGERPYSTFTAYLNTAELKESETLMDPKAMVEALLVDSHVILKLEREAVKAGEEVNDAGTVDMLTTFISQKEKNNWMLAAYLGK